jgi:hypothetical protein
MNPPPTPAQILAKIIASNSGVRPHGDAAHVRYGFGLLCEPGGVYEVRALNGERGGRTIAGYYDDLDAMTIGAMLCTDSIVGGLSMAGFKAECVYWTLNEVNRVLIARSANELSTYVERGMSVADADIVKRRWLLIDCDPKRPSGISSSDKEHEKALAKAREVAAFLRARGFKCIVADSGNGAHVLVRIDLPNDAEATALVKGVLAALDARFSDAEVTIDRANFNASRICKVYGTVARKGSNLPERPHRLTRILEVDEPLSVASREMLEALVKELTPEPKSKATRNGTAPKRATSSAAQGTDYEKGVAWLNGFIAKHGIIVTSTHAYNGGICMLLAQCPWMAEHSSNGHSDVALFVQSDGKPGFNCQHGHCVDRDWKVFRKHFEPDYDDEPDPIDPYTDIPLSNQFVAGMGDEGFRYVAEFDRWYQYEAAEGRWKVDRKLRIYTEAKRFLTDLAREIVRKAREEARKAIEEAEDAGQKANEKLLEAILKKALDTFDELTEAKKVNAVVAMTRSHERVATVHQQFDADIHLLNCQGVAVNLRTGQMRAATPADMFTKTTPYAPRDEPTPNFDKFTYDIMGVQIKPENCKCAACAISQDKNADERSPLHLMEVDRTGPVPKASLWLRAQR